MPHLALPAPAALRHALAALAACATTLAAAPPAEAGEYKIWNCHPPGVSVPGGALGDWQFEGAGVGFNDCSTGGGFGAGAVTNMSPGAHVSWKAQAPANAYIRRLRAWTVGMLGPKYSSPSAYAEFPRSLNGACFNGASSTSACYSAAADGTQVVGDFRITPIDHQYASSANQTAVLRWECLNSGLECTKPSSNTFFSVRGVEMTVVEGTEPTIGIDGGTLFAGGDRSGTQRLTYNASDAESGIAVVEVLFDGVAVLTKDFSGDLAVCPHTRFAACTPTRSEGLDIDTTTVPDGTYTVALRVTDAAGNVRTANGPSAVTVRNSTAETPATQPSDQPSTQPGDGTATQPGDTSTSQPAAPSGPGSGDGTVFASPVAQPTVATGTPNGANASRTAKVIGFFASDRRRLLVRYGSTPTIRGRLVDEAGRPIGAAVLTVLSRTLVPRAAQREIGTVRTQADGSWRYRARRGPSRLIRFAYRAFAGDREFAHQTELTLRVRAGARLSSTPRTLRNGQRVTFRGRLLGGSIPKGGKLVEMQVRRGARWQTFATTRASTKGTFRYRYRFLRTPRTTRYTFRARVRSESAYPWSTGYSRATRVTVRGR